MAENWIFRPEGKMPEGRTALPGNDEIKKGLVDGPYDLHVSRASAIGDAIYRGARAIGMKTKEEPGKGIRPAPRASGYSGSVYQGANAVGDVTYNMISDEINANGYEIVELDSEELYKMHRNRKGAEDISLGGNRIYIAKDLSSEEKAEVAYHELRTAILANKHRKPHEYFHPQVEKEQKKTKTPEGCRELIEHLYN